MKTTGTYGFSLIELIVVLGIISLLLSLFFVGIQSARESGRSTACKNNLRQISLGTLHYESTHGRFPSGVKPYYSCLVALMPYLDETSRFNSLTQRIQDDKWSPHYDIFTEVPITLICPSEQPHEMIDKTCYLGNGGPAWLIDPDRKSGVFSGRRYASDITDGLSNTIAFTEFAYGTLSNRVRGVDVDLRGLDIPTFDHAVRNAVATHFEGQIGSLWFTNGISMSVYTHYLTPGNKSAEVNRGNLSTGAYSPSSNHGSLVNIAKADGSVSSTSYSVDRNVWVQLGHISDGGQMWF